MASVSLVKPVKIDLDIGDQLTSISCGHIVVELIKFIAYQRQQIPYTYPWLKQLITNKKLSIDDEKESLQSERHFHIASTALHNLDFILKNLLQEINGAFLPDEVCIALGATPITCKEMYKFILPRKCHKPQCHSPLIANDQKIHRNVFRSLVTTEVLSQILFKPLSPTNMYVFMKKKTISGQETVVSCDNFQPTSGFRIPRNSKIVLINFQTQNIDNITCCNKIKIFGDVSGTMDSIGTSDPILDQDDQLYEIESSDTAMWYQSCYVVKGFKDSIVDGTSITNMWTSS